MNYQNEKIFLDSFYFTHPATILLCGPTKSGKTTLLSKILLNSDRGLVRPPPATIVYCYTQWQDAYDEIKIGRAQGPSYFNVPAIVFNEGLPDLDAIDLRQNTLIILDDLMHEAGKSEKILNIFTTDSHHKNMSVIFVTQNIFSQQINSRTISLNCQYIILTNNPRDRLQVQILGKQMFPGDSQFFNKAYNNAVSSKQYGYLLCDFTQLTLEENRVQTGVFAGEERIIYRNE